MKTKRAFRIFVWSLAVVSFLAGVILISTNFIKNFMRKQVSVTAIEAVESVIDDGGGDITIEVPVADFLKVDGENGEEELAGLYKKQLELYARAASQIMGKQAGEKILYSFALDKCITLKD